MEIPLTFLGPKPDIYKEIKKVFSCPFEVVSSPYHEDNYDELTIESKAGSVRFFSSSVPQIGKEHTSLDIYHLDISASIVGDKIVAETGVNIEVYYQALSNVVENNVPDTVGTYNFTTFYKPLVEIDYQTEFIIVSGISISTNVIEIGIRMSDYEDSVCMKKNYSADFWRGHTLVGII